MTDERSSNPNLRKKTDMTSHHDRVNRNDITRYSQKDVTLLHNSFVEFHSMILY